MTRLLVALLLVPASLALAKEEASTAAPPEDPMAAWVPPKLTNAARTTKEIKTVMQAWEAAQKRGDIEAAAALVDFPVLMATDNKEGEGMAESWDREKWMEVMKPFYGKPMPDMKVTHKPNVFVLSDSLVSVDDVATVKMGARTMTMRNTTLMVRRDGKWLVKAMAEPGWGDMPQIQSAGAGAPGSKSEGTGSAGAAPGSTSEGTGSGVQEPPTGTGSGASEPPKGTGSDAKEPAQGTSK